MEDIHIVKVKIQQNITIMLAVDWAAAWPILAQPGPVFCWPIKAQRPILAQIWHKKVYHYIFFAFSRCLSEVTGTLYLNFPILIQWEDGP